ncbi:MAG: hypothetical protein B6244_10040 [Candidatus Cloacimonetes bacterium 4572_55]|nr:MAG: hypothetical protein B6244_10040 [Candidatus Cloacimonetes bacterium 4572_55]
MPDKIINILFVCTGNTCRSAMAEGLLRRYIPSEIRKYVQVSSAGSMGDGYPGTDLAIFACREVGIDISGHSSRLITEEIIQTSDLILTMTRIHKEQVLFIDPRAHTKTFLIAEYAGLGGGRDVGDPIGGEIDLYRRTRDELTAYIHKFLPRITLFCSSK